MNSGAIDDLGNEARKFSPSAEFVSGSHVRDESLHREGSSNPEAFWERHARDLVSWSTPWHTACEWQLPFAKW
ncbi:MAG: acetate--CoA ligase, partial [Actinomycetota bacterium]